MHEERKWFLERESTLGEDTMIVVGMVVSNLE